MLNSNNNDINSKTAEKTDWYVVFIKYLIPRTHKTLYLYAAYINIR